MKGPTTITYTIKLMSLSGCQPAAVLADDVGDGVPGPQQLTPGAVQPQRNLDKVVIIYLSIVLILIFFCF